MALTDRA